MASKGSAGAITDFFIALGFDATEVKKGFAEINKMFAASQKKQTSAVKAAVDKQTSIKTTASDKVAKANIRANKRQAQQAAREARLVHNHQAKLAKDYDALQLRRDAIRFSATRSRNRMLGSLQNSRGAINPKVASSPEFANFNNRQASIMASVGTARTKAEFQKLRQEMRLLNDSYGRLVLMNKRVQKEFQASAFSAKAMSDSMRNMARSYLSVFAVVGGGGMAAKSGMNLASAQVGLITGTGSYEAAGKELEFLKEVSRVYGTATTDTIKAYGKISAGAKTAGLSVEQIRELFIGLNEAAVGFSLTADEMTGVFKAITDSFSKGTLMAEELKGQLGDRMPVAIGAMSKALGVTTPQLFKMMENGELISSEVLPKLSKGLQAMARDSGGFAAGMKASGREMSRFGSMFEQSIGKSFESGLERGLAEFFKYMTAITKQSGPAFKTIGRIVGALLEFIGVTALAIKQIFRPFIILLDSFSSKTDDVSKSVGWLTRMLAGLVAVILTPFALMEQWNDKLEKMDGGFGKFALTLGTVIAKSYALFKVFGLIFKVFKSGGAIAKWLSGWGIVTTVFNSLKNLVTLITGAKGIGGMSAGIAKFGGTALKVFTALAGHPLIKVLLMLATKFGLEDALNPKESIIQSGQFKGQAQLPSMWESLQQLFGDVTSGRLFTDPFRTSAESLKTSSGDRRVMINVTAHNPQELVNAVKPYLLDTVDQRIDYTIMTSMNNQD